MAQLGNLLVRGTSRFLSDINCSGTIAVGTLNGNATSATKLATARNIKLAGAVSGSASFNGTADVTINTKVQYGTSAPSSLADGVLYCVIES